MVAFAGHPLVLGERVVGVMALFARRPLAGFVLQALGATADNIAAGIQRKQAESSLLATAAELQAARRIQEHLFPPGPPAVAGYDIGGRAYPAEATGGDYYDYFPLANGALAFTIGDVSGHGLGPALLMASTRARLRALALVHAEVNQLLFAVNQSIRQDIEDEFVTLALARLDPSSGAIAYSSAGHPAGYVLDRDGQVKARLESTGVPLGVLPDADYPVGPPVTLEPGELVLLVTDGLLDTYAPDNTPFGSERALAIARLYRHDPAAQIVANLYGAVRAFAQGSPQQDDVSALVIKRQALPATPAHAAP
jgi:phosphoserine phosphatase RsbU/P